MIGLRGLLPPVWVLIGMTVIAQSAGAGEGDCGPLTNAYGPYDYTNPQHRRQNLQVVETHHFDLNVETLARGKSSTVVGDLDYTLRAFPNHHRALRAMARYQIKNGYAGQSGVRSMECYFDRAKRLNANDAEVYTIHGWYLHMRGEWEGALAQYRQAEKLKPNAVDRDYKLGLLFFDMKRYDEARRYAERAYRRKFPDNTLRDKLKSVNQWRG